MDHDTPLPEPRIDLQQSIRPPLPLPSMRVVDHAVRVPGSELAPPVITYVMDAPARDRWVLVKPYTYVDGEHRIRIPAGFTFDLASVPRAVWSIIAPFELSIAAPLLHDFLYRHGGVPPQGTVTPYRTWTRAEADRLFRDVMAREGVPGWRRWAAYSAVRAFGGGSWRGSGPRAVQPRQETLTPA